MAAEPMQFPHKLTLLERKNLTLSGVTEVVSFDEESVALRTPLGDLIVQGQGLQLKTLLPEGGQVEIRGQIGAMIYEEPKAPGGFFRRLLG